jgi:hypothetical protein
MTVEQAETQLGVVVPIEEEEDSRKVPVILVRFNDINCSRQIFKKYSSIKFHITHPVGAELFHADEQTVGRANMTNLIIAFRNFTNVPNDNFFT